MASSLCFTVLYHSYPIGNTTAVCLTRDVPPDVPANILLLPCGDPRNILYTLFCEKSNRLRRSLDFTCCDYDPGILARNVLLLTMIMDRVAAPTMWNIFFHMYLDIDSRSTLVSQSQKLAAYPSVEAWRSSPYGAVIKMGTDHTFAELRRHWELYADFYQPSKLHRFRVLQEMMDARLKVEAATAPEDNLTPIRSSGLLFLHSQASSLFSALHRGYWATGTTFTDKIKLAAATYPNSTFLYSRAEEGFNVSPNTDPMIPFPHDALFGNAGDRTLTIEDLVDSAQSQFRAWCSAFQTATKAVKSPSTLIVIRFLLGDVLAVSRALRDFPENRPRGAVQGHPLAAPRVAPWTACPMELNWEEYADLGTPARFDVIDTSNVSDYLGLLNLFLATAPLLTGSSSSVLYTETFGLFASDPSIEFEATLFASLSVAAVLMDLAPVDVLSGFTSTCNTHELVLTFLRSKDKDVHQQRFTWKRPSSGDPSAYADGGPCAPASFDTHQLAKLLHNIYLDMFRSEDPIHVPAIGKAVKGRNDATARALLHGVIVCPSRESFTVFLGFIRTSLQISEEEWSDIMRSFLAMRSENQPYFDKLRDSDIHAQLYRYGLYTVPKLDHVCNPSTTPEPGRLSFWPSVPPLIRVFFTVPRAEFATLERGVAGSKVPFNVWMHCVIDTGRDQDPHIFQSLDVAYGALVDTGTAAAPDLSFREDPDGHKNGADLVFSFVVPSRVLTEPRAAMVRLRVRSEPNTVMFLMPVLGRAMCVFSANLEDTDYLPLPLPSPSRPSSHTRVARPDEVVAIGYQPLVRVELDNAGKQIASLTAKLELTNPAAQAAFAGGVMPSVSQCSPCAVQVVLGGRTQILAYPVPIMGSRRKLRLARKSSYIEVVVPVAIPFLEPDGFKVNQFPVVRTNTSLVPWNIHRVFLDQLPVLNRANISNTQLDAWYGPHLSWQRSLRERTAFMQDPTHSDALVNVKQTIDGIMMLAAGLGGAGTASARVFALQHSVRKDTDTILFVDKIRYDDAGHIMVLDAFVLVVSEEILPHVSAALRYLVGQGVIQIPVHGGEKELCAWKRLLPALIERCRAMWTHGANCEYSQPDGNIRIPRELPAVPGDQGNPLCSCGRGKDVEGMMKDRVWRMFAPYVTRIALSPLFGVSHVEQILESHEMPGPENLRQEIQPGPAPPASSPAPVAAMGSKTHISGSGSNSDGPRVAAAGKSVAAPVATCDRCKKRESGGVKLLKCSRCKSALYCSEACQKSDWKTHKSRCKN